MEGLSFKLEIFEGPLDALLALIQKHKLNIQDIEISVLLDQFMLYLSRMAEADLEITSDFLEMAARLIMIKSAALLPREEAEQMKRELQGALIEYALCKTMAERLKKRYLGDVVFVREPMELDIDKSYHKLHQPEELMLAYSALNERTRRKASYRPEVDTPDRREKLRYGVHRNCGGAEKPAKERNRADGRALHGTAPVAHRGDISCAT